MVKREVVSIIFSKIFVVLVLFVVVVLFVANEIISSCYFILLLKLLFLGVLSVAKMFGLLNKLLYFTTLSLSLTLTPTLLLAFFYFYIIYFLPFIQRCCHFLSFLLHFMAIDACYMPLYSMMNDVEFVFE